MEVTVDSTASSDNERTVSTAARSLTGTSSPTSSVAEVDSQLKADTTQDLDVPLDSYIALGSITSSQSTPKAVNTSEWTEVVDSAYFVNQFSNILVSTLIQRLHDAKWIRVFVGAPLEAIICKIYLLPDDAAHVAVDRSNKALRSDLGNLAPHINISPAAWNGASPGDSHNFDIWATGIDKSMFWMFNTLPSPSPSVEHIEDRYSCVCFNELLDNEPQIPGLKATLYGYQARSVALMIQKESAPHINLDPRFEERLCPDGHTFYYSARDLIFRRQPPRYESVRGGILAETMGVGKTVMCIALMLATKHHLPRIPPERLQGPPVRERLGSLGQMAAAAANRAGVPLKSHFRWAPQKLCPLGVIKMIEEEKAVYEIPHAPRRSVRKNRTHPVPPPRQIALCSATIIVVPRNLIHQWRAELGKHATNDENGLHFLVLEDIKDRLPSAAEILAQNVDVLLFSKPRFEAEIKDGKDDQGRNSANVPEYCQCPYIGATRIRDCSCFKPEDVYSSPLKQLHFLRIIIDEGHEFSSATSNAVRVATELVTAERRWVVSGTPAKDRLFGVDVDLASNVAAEDLVPLIREQEIDVGASMSIAETKAKIAAALDRRMRYHKNEEMKGAAKSIGILAANFLGVRPWSGTDDGQRIDWEDYAFRHEKYPGRTYTAFSSCIPATLQTLVVKTRPEDFDKDVVLPPLEHKIVYLEPSFYDTLTINLFIFFITNNAVTSERTDVDYLFHPKSTPERHSLLRNLRRSAFFWTGWSEEDVQSAVETGQRYLEKENTLCTQEDRVMLQGCLDFAKMVLGSGSWSALSSSHELGVFTDSWPGGRPESWALNTNETPTMMGAKQLRKAQRLINDQLFDEVPTEGLEEMGAAEMAEVVAAAEQERDRNKKKGRPITKMGVPTSGLESGESLNSHFSPRKVRPNRSVLKKQQEQPSCESNKNNDVQEISCAPTKKIPTKSLKRKRSDSIDSRELLSDSPLAVPSIVGTVSSKVSYLLSRVMALQKEEKILIFYDADNTAYYLAECLELMHVKHLIYSGRLKPELRSRYIVAFDTDDRIRVLLMDISHGAFGLNINKASRVFFVNPPFKPHTEAQAIKRAHRIGQTKPVYVETLILRGTIEEAIFKRSSAMTREEHDLAGKEIFNDKGVTEIIQNARSIPVRIEDGVGWGQMAPLEKPLQIFGRSGRREIKIEGIDKLDPLPEEYGDEKKKKKKKKQRKK